MRLYKKLVSACLLGNFVVTNTPLCALAASEIFAQDGKFATQTTIQNNGNLYNVQTNTTAGGGTIGINAFSKFNVGQGDTVNLNLINNQNKLVNLIYDNSPSQINGIVNSYMGGQIGGNVLFANPNGFVVGQSGVFNVGSLTLMTPSQSSMKDLLNDSVLGGGYNEEKIERLVGFTFNDQNYLVTGNKYEPVKLDTGKIEIAGKINSGKGINLFSGGEVNLLSGSELNANMNFTINSGNVTATPSPITPAAAANYPQKLAMQDGKDIVIVASDNKASNDMMSAIVNLNGKVYTNGGDLILRTEVFQTDKSGDAKSQINIKNGSDIQAHNVIAAAVSKIEDYDRNIIGVTDLSKQQYYGYLGDVVNFVTDKFVHLASADTSINVEDGASINAANDVSLSALSDMDLKSGLLDSTLIDMNFNFSSIASKTNAIVKKGSSITAKNLKVDATTDLDLDTSTKSTNLVDSKIGKDIGSYAVSVTTTDLQNGALIEQGANLSVGNDIEVNAKTTSNHKDITKNGLIPVVDKNRGDVGAGASIIITNVDNQAVMNADADINGKLKVNADYSGKIVSRVTGYSGAKGEDGTINNLFQHFKSYKDITEVASRSNAKFNDVDIAGAIGIIVDKVNSTAKIGDSSKNIKPTINAGQIEVKSKITDNKSSLYVQAESENGAKAASGALAINYKDLNANSNVYGNLTLNNANSGNALTIKSDTEIIHPMAWLDWFETFKPFFEGKTWQYAFDEVKNHWNNVETNNVTDYLAKLGAIGELKHIMDEGDFSIFNAVDFNNLGAYGFFNTFAQSKASAMQKTGETKALSGAIAIALHNTNANAVLENGSTVTLRTTNSENAGIDVSSSAKNEIWTAATLMSIPNIKKVLSGSTARDGSAFGVGAAFSYADSDVIAKIGENVVINRDLNLVNSAVGNLNVSATESGNYLTVSAGSSSPDKTGLSGSVGMTVLGSGKVQASVENGASVYAKDVNVKASKGDNFINAVIAFANGQDSFGFGLSGVVLTDSVDSYIAGNVNSLNSININANYDKTVINANANIGIAKEGTDDPAGEKHQSGDEIENYWGLRELFDEGTSDLNWYNLIEKGKRKSDKINDIVAENDKNYDYTRAVNPDKETKAAAGGINLVFANNKVKASIKDGAVVSAEKDVKVKAKSTDKIIDSNAVVAANGKTGAGGTIMADISDNTVESSIGAATVNAKENTEVTANADFNLIAASAGVATGKDKAGAGNVSSAVQVNNITAAIKDGAKVNETVSGTNQNVKVEGKADSKVIKAVGALAVQAGGKGESSGGSVGGTVDGDVVSNTINAYIKGASVNASGSIDVNAVNEDRLIVVDVAGSASTQGSAYAGTIGAYIAANDINAYIENSNINQNNNSNTQTVNLKATSTFNEIDVVGTVAGGDKTGVGGSARVDAVVNNMNSYIKNSTVKATKSASLTNSDSISQISVAVAGAGSSKQSAGAGVINVLADVTEQNNYIENSDLTVGQLSLNSDKTMKTLSVTGALAIAVKGSSVGLSGYAVGASHDINTYIKNSNVHSVNDISLASDFTQDSLNIIFGGAGGKGFAGSGAISVLVNDSNLNTYIYSDVNSTKKTIISDNGKLSLKSENDIDTITVNGNVSISTSGSSAGGAINTTVYNSTVKAGVDGVSLTTKNGVDISAKANQNHIIAAIGAAAGDGVSVDGSVVTMVMNQDVNAYLKNSTVKTDSNININSDDILAMIASLGAVAGSVSSSAVGASVLTSVINGDVKSEIDKVVINKNSSAIGGLNINATQSDSYGGFAIAGAAGNSVAVAGAANTIVQNKNVSAVINELIANSDNLKYVAVNADSLTQMTHAAGQLAVSMSSVAVGGSVSTLVSNKTVRANVLNSDFVSNGNVKINAKSEEQIDANAVGASGSSQVAVNGSVNTVVSSNTVEAKINNSSVQSNSANADGNGVTVSAKDDLSIVGRTGAISGSGSVAVGGAVITGVVNNSVKAFVENSDVKAGNANVTVSAETNEISGSSSNPFLTVAASGAGTAAISGAIDTIVLNSEAVAKISGYKNAAKGVEAGNNVNINANGSTELFVSAGAGGGAGTVGVGATVNTLVVNKTIKATAESTKIQSKKLNVNANADDEFNTISVAGSGGGVVGVGGDILTNVISSNVEAGIINDKIDKNFVNIDSDEVSVSANANAEFLDVAGALGIGGTAGVGATVSTNVIGYKVKASVNNANVADFSKLNVSATSKEVYNFNSISGAGGVAGVAGVINTNVINNTVEAAANGVLTGKANSSLIVNAKDDAEYAHLIAGTMSGGAVGVGATIATNSISSTILASAGGEINVDNLSVKAEGVQTYDDMYVMGFAGGGVGISGSALALIVDATVKAYTLDNSRINAANLTLDAKNTVNISETVGTAAVAGTAAVGASVGVNKITNTVEAYTGGNNIVNVSKDIVIKASSTNNIGKENDGVKVVAGAVSGVAGVAGVAGAVLVNYIEDKVNSFVGEANTIQNAQKLAISSEANSNIYEYIGGYGVGGFLGAGASVGVNTIGSTAVANIGANSAIIMPSGNVVLNAKTNEKIVANADIVGGGGYALSGGVLFNTIGQSVANASANKANDAETDKVAESAKKQSQEILDKSASNQQQSNDFYKKYYNKASEDLKTAMDDANSSAKTLDAKSNVALFAKSEKSGATYNSTDRANTTSAFVDSGVNITANNVEISADNTNDVDLSIRGNTFGGASLGVSAAVSNVKTTTNAFVSNNAEITSNGTIKISANSNDNQDVTAKAASGGILSGSGAVAIINSNKTTNAYVLNGTSLNANNDLSIGAKSSGVVNSTVSAGSYGGITVGVSVANAEISGETKVDLGNNVSIKSNGGNIEIKAEENEKATANATAATGSLAGGTGAEANAKAGKTNTVKVGKNSNIFAKLAAKFSSIGKNEAIAETNARAYGGISAGGTKTTSKINHNGGVNIADSDKNYASIQAASINISSESINNADSKTTAGAGAAVGISGSGVYNDITANNNIYVGNNILVKTTNGSYILSAKNSNTYKGFNDSSAYGIVGTTVGIIKNTVSSTVNTTSNANAEANGGIGVFADNEIKKAAVSNYDLYGGSGGVVGVGSAMIEDNLVLTTNSTLGGEYAYANGVYGIGSISVSSTGKVDVNEKIDVTASGGIPVSDGDVSVYSNVNTSTTINNKNIKTKDDNIYYTANNDIDIYTKSNVASYGGIAVADGSSVANNSNAIASVIFNSGVNSVSGRDSYIQAVSDKNVQAYMYAITKGLIGAVGDSYAFANNSSTSKIVINSGTNLKSYDSMNLTVLDTTSNVSAVREAKGTTYLLFGIPITIYGKGHQDSTNNSNSVITLNGSIESGLGANRKLTINSDGTYTSDGVNVIGKEKVGEITSSDIDLDMEAYEKSRDSELDFVEDYIKVQKDLITEAENKIKNDEKARDELVVKNGTYQTAIDNANTLISNNNDISNIDNVTSAWNNAYDSKTGTLASSFGTSLAGYKNDANMADVNTAYASYIKTPNALTLSALKTAVDGLSVKKQEISASSASISSTITDINANVDITNNNQLNSFISTTRNSINSNTETIANYNSSIAAANNNISDLQETISDADKTKLSINQKYSEIINDLQRQKDEMGSTGAPVYSFVVDNIYVRSGEVNIRGNVEGTGSITAPGNNFTIDIVNNSVSDVVYKDIQIDRNASGGINASSVASSIKKKIKNSGRDFHISIENTVDANDPTINLNTKNGFGDIVLRGNVENVNGLVSFVNYTGNILSEGSITAKDLKITVPNGGYTQQYDNSSVVAGGSSGAGAIVASGNIDIASKIIDVNGLIQSGSEIKSVTIPNFKVKKRNGVYYQVVNGVETKLEKGATDGYYYLNIAGNGELDSELEMIKAYFKPSDISDVNNIKGEIHLFKAEIGGGNITLTGNIVSSSNNGQIVLVNGYGHIDVTNNSNFDLVTSALNADAKVQGKLTINDLKFSDTDKGGSAFDNIKQSDITDSWLANNAGTYTASVDESGNIKTSSKGQTAGNGSFGATSTETRADGAKVDTILYNPGDDAYIVTKAGSTETKSYLKYVKRSWWTELWHGKLYQRIYYTITHDPEYATAKNTIKVKFQGFDKPEINVTSNGSVIMNSSISALTGDVNLKSNNGFILNKSTNNVISAENIGLSASNGDIGNQLRNIQTAVYNNGSLSANGNNIYINYPYSDISNINITATGNAYLATSGGKLGGLDSVVNISADSLELRAENGSIELDSSENSNINIDVNKIKARANGDISLVNKNDLNIQSIVSTSYGTIFLGSQNGSINAVDTETINPYHINGGNVILSAVNGAVGSAANAIKIARDGIFKVTTKDDVNLNSVGRIYVDSIKSVNGKVTLNADYGIIASKNSDNLVYNISSVTGVDLNSKFGNIENIAINTDGVINASAGYDNGVASGMSDISISLISKEELSQEYLDSLTTDEERQQALDNYQNGLKDMKIGSIKASKNVFLTSEKSIINSDENSAIKGEQVVLSAGLGNIGSENSEINLTANRDITAYAGNGASIYLKSNRDLNINEIRSFNTYDAVTGTTTSDSTLAKVVLSTAGNIVNAAYDEKANVVAENILLTVGNDIGSVIKYFNVNTKSSDVQNGLQYSAENAYINGIGSSLNVISAVVNGDANISSLADLSVVVKDVSAGGMLNIKSCKDTALVGNIAANGVNIVSAAQTNLSDIVINSPLENTSDKLVVSNSTLQSIKTDSTTAEILNSNIINNADITTTGTTTIGNANVGGDFVNNSANTNVSEITVAGNTDITSTETTTIGNANIGGNFVNNSKDTQITNKLTVAGDTNINAANSISIANADLKNLTTNSTIAEVADMTISENANITTSDKTLITNAVIKGDLTNGSVNTEIKNISVVGNSQITSTETTTIGNANVGGDFVNNSKDTQITNKLTVAGDTNINAANSISIANADLKNILNIKSKDLSVKDLSLGGNINAQVDRLDITASQDFNIGIIFGNTNSYVDDVKIISRKSIYNGLSDNDDNFNVKSIDLKANDNIGTENTPLNILLAEGNKISVEAGKVTSVKTKGAGANYTKLETGFLNIDTNADVNINAIKADKLAINTTSDNLTINNLVIGTEAIFNVGKKRIVINNTGKQPLLDADIQLYMTQTPGMLIVNGSNNIITNAINVTRQGRKILVNDDMNYNSMNNTTTTLNAALMRNTKVGERTVEKTEALIYEMPTTMAYENLYLQKYVIQASVKNQIEEVITSNNALNVVNIDKDTNISENENSEKISPKQQLNNKISSL